MELRDTEYLEGGTVTSQPKRGTPIIMTDETTKVARLMRVIDQMTKELDRQALAEAMANLAFNPWLWPRLSSRAQTEMSSRFMAPTDPHPVGPRPR